MQVGAGARVRLGAGGGGVTRRWLAIAIPPVSVALTVVGGVIVFTAPKSALDDGSEWGLLSFFAPIVAFAVVGGLIARRQPHNSIGWMLAAVGLLFAMVVAFSALSIWSVRTGSLPQAVGEWANLGAAAWVPALGVLGNQLPLRLPDGRLASPRWRTYSRVSIGLIVVAWLAIILEPGRVADEPGTSNPLGTELAEILAVAVGLMILSFIGAVASLVRRYRRADARARAQLRVIAFGGVVFLVIYLLSLFVPEIVGWGAESTEIRIAENISQVAFAALPVSIGVAILRHRLYDLGVVVNRTLVYGALTATLATAYLAIVLLLQLVLQPVTEQSDLAIAGSTLAVAALARPARSRIQALVDRRFYRRRYDAAHTIESFGARLRDQVELDALSGELRMVVAETMQPAHVSLWLREASR
jgi:hypothetical protein